MKDDDHSKSGKGNSPGNLVDNTEWTAERMHAGCKANDNEAWVAVYNYILAFLKKDPVPSVVSIEDIAGETFLYFRQGGVNIIKKGYAYKQWLRLKARAVRTDMCYRGARTKEKSIEVPDTEGGGYHDIPIQPHQVDDPEMILFTKEVLKVIKTELKAIGPKCEKFLKRYFRARFLGENQKAVAWELGVSYTNFRGIVYKCRQKLIGREKYEAVLKRFRRDVAEK